MSRSSGVAPTDRCSAGEREPARAGRTPSDEPLVAAAAGGGLVTCLDSPPRTRHRDELGEHPPGQFRFCPERRVIGDPAGPAAVPVVRPGPPQVQLAASRPATGPRRTRRSSTRCSAPTAKAAPPGTPARRRDGASANTPATSANVLGRPDLCRHVRQLSEGHFGRPINPA
jgi:hypothetical protein